MLKIHSKSLGTVRTLCLQGRVVRGETVSLRTAMDFQSGISTVVLDFARVSTIDAAGLGVMLELREEAQSNGVRFKLMNLTKAITQVLEITHLNAVFEVTSAAALSSADSFAPAASVPELASCA